MKELSKKKRFLYRILDLFSLFLFGPFLVLKKKQLTELNNFLPKRILFIEFHGIGDLVLLSGAIDPIKNKWPEVDIWILAKPMAKDLFSNDPRVKGVITFDFPWAAWGCRYNIFAWPWKKLLTLIRSVRLIKFDFVLGRPDLPMSLFVGSLNIKYSFGYNLPGGSFLLSHLLPCNQNIKDHEQMIWEGYLKKLDVSYCDYTPKIILDPKFKKQAKEIMAQLPEGTNNSPLIGIHPGASHHLQRWPRERFSQIAAELSNRARILWFLDGEVITSEICENKNVLEVQVPIPVFLYLLSFCDLLIANDSGPMHLAAALHTQVVAVFGPQLPARFAPRNFCKPVIADGISCRPCTNKCRYYVPPCLKRISVDMVLENINALLRNNSRKFFREVL